MKKERFQNKLAMLLTIALVLTRLHGGVCEAGCLSCNVERNVCDLCDAVRGYVKAGDVCVNKYKDNCTLSSAEGRCLKCAKGYSILDGNCVKMTSEEENSCDIFQSTRSCLLKPIGSFYHDMIFQSVYRVIDRCLDYLPNRLCHKCQAGYHLSHDKKSCQEPLLSDENCAVYGNFECHECAQGFILDVNGYAHAWRTGATNSTLDEFFSDYIIKKDTGYQGKSQVCFPMTLAGCKAYGAFQKCAECEEGYYLKNDGSCHPNPLPSVENCLRYNHLLDCEECVAGYYLQGSFTCIPITAVANCAVHDGSARTSACKVCQDSYFLSKAENGTKSCVTRVASLNIPNCITKTVDKDTCAECGKGYALSADHSFCYKLITNCKTFTPPAKSTDQVVCSKCDDGYMKSNTECVKGQVENCKEYQSSECSVCAFGFVLVDKKCVAMANQQVLKHCVENDPSNPNSCATCDIVSDLFTIKHPCKPVSNPIPNCSLYNIQGQCTQCESGYQLSPEFTCNKVDPNLICLAKNASNVCTECKKGYYLNSSNLCVPFLEMFYYNCDEIEQLPNGTINCLTCSQNSTPVIIDGLVSVCESPYSNNDALTPAPIPNCMTYNTNNSCRQCRDTFLLDESDGTCLNEAACTTGILLERIEEVSGVYSVTGKRVCLITDSVPDCKFYGTNYERDDPASGTKRVDYVCIACKDEFYAQTPLPIGLAHIYDQGTASSDFTVRKAAITTCVLKSTADQTNFISKGDLSNCEVVLSDESSNFSTYTTYYACYQCRFGFTGAPSILDAKYYIPICSKMPECDAGVRYSGLSYLANQIKTASTDYPNLPFDGFLTCHKCVTDGHIPVFAATHGDYTVKTSKTLVKNDLVGFKLTSDPPSSSENSSETSQSQTQCLSASYLATLGSGTFPNFCGAAMVLVNIAKALYLSADTSIICVACQPGYKATLIDSTTYPTLAYGVQTCTKIDNCKSSTRFNGCSICENGHALEYDSDAQRPKIDSCVQVGADCLYGTGVDSKCAICKDGYFLHTNGQCYMADFKSCNIFNVKSLYNYKTTGMTYPRKMDFLLMQSGFSQGTGCLKCESSYRTTQRYFTSQKICMKNPILTDTSSSSSTVPASAGYINNCANYYFETQMKCQKCLSNYVLSLDKKNCYPVKGLLLNCKLANNSSQCSQCIDGYFLNSDFVCRQGKVANCASFSSETTCSLCAYGYILYQNSCYLMPEANCEEFDFSQVTTSKTITCTKCKSFYFSFANTLNDESSLKICLPYDRLIENCELLSRTASNLLQCDKCKADYYLHSNKKVCMPRTKIANCQQSHITNNYCQQCAPGYYLSPLFDACLPNPTGILHCQKYNGNAACARCNRQTYLSQGKCFNLSVNQIVDECLGYLGTENDGETVVKCTECIHGRILIDNKCIVARARNCLTYTDTITCATCSDRFELKRDNEGVVSCVEISISGCLRYTRVENKVACLVCDNGYYLVTDFECRKSTRIISGCAFYDRVEGLCKLCAAGKVLSANRTRCQEPLIYGSIYPPNCAYLKYLSNPICQECRPGYYFNAEKKCVKCSTDENCLYCDTTSPDKCLVCSPGSYQNANRQCVKTLDVTPNPDSPTKSTNTSSSSSIQKILGELIPLIFVILSYSK